MSLSWNEVRIRAAAFAEEWADATYEKGESQSFYVEFFDVFGIKRRRVAVFEQQVKKLDDSQGFIDVFWPGVLLAEQKSAGRDLSAARAQAYNYCAALKDKEHPRFVLLCDFQTFELIDLETGDEWAFPLAELPDYVQAFGFMLGRQKRTFREQPAANIEASELLGAVHDALKASGYRDHDLQRYLVRLLFCMFADDTGIFQPRGLFEDFLKERTEEDGSDLGGKLAHFFQVLDTDYSDRASGLDEDLAKFPYINGDLFAENLRIPSFDTAGRQAIIEACEFAWEKVSPAIFGSLFQSVMDSKERRAKGAHYTSEANILKVIGPLFLDELHAEFARLKELKRDRRKRLDRFRGTLADLTFFDPACGCGNFLVIAYRELRQLELDVLVEIHGGDKQDLWAGEVSVLNVDQFHGIELEEFPARIAEVAMWMADHIANNALSEKFGQVFARIPLKASPHIVHGDALEMDWQDVLPAARCSYVFGNPPFIGKKEQTPKQKAQVRKILKNRQGCGEVDYVSCWFVKSVDYVTHSCPIAFVSTNSIVQGEQVKTVWHQILEREKQNIIFAHRTFEWTNEGRKPAHVHVVIIGLRRKTKLSEVRVFDYPDLRGAPEEFEVSRLNAYLIEWRNVFVEKCSKPNDTRPTIRKGSEATDWGLLTLDSREARDMLLVEGVNDSWVRPYWGGDEYIGGDERFCLWLADSEPREFGRIPAIAARLDLLKKKRGGRTKAKTLALAKYPWLFGENRQPREEYILIPKVSSERRDYVPMGFVDPGVIVSGSAQFIVSSDRCVFGILTSAMHMSWMRTTGGRTKSDYQYTNTLVYNTFPWPDLTPAKEAKIADLAQAVLDARAAFPESTLADLYDPDLMPPVLRKAHQALDRAVDRLYRTKPFESERERVEHLFGLYEKMVAPIEAAAKGKPKRRRKKSA